ncbi:MAG: nitrilase-related carbon-nitrogen hydrolase, partial [Pirellulaceae bacterium]
MKQPITIASCQFSVEADISRNRDTILAQIKEAADQGARIIHFSETALSGYAGVDIPSAETIDWDQLCSATREICQRAADHGVWVLLGSTHRLGPD